MHRRMTKSGRPSRRQLASQDPAVFYPALAEILENLGALVARGPASVWRIGLAGQLAHAARCAHQAEREARCTRD